MTAAASPSESTFPPLPDLIRRDITGLVLAGGLGRRMSADGAGVAVFAGGTHAATVTPTSASTSRAIVQPLALTEHLRQ